MPTRTQHFSALASLHRSPDTADGARIYRALRRIECRMARAAEDACNTPRGAARYSALERVAENQVLRLFGHVLSVDGFFCNGDPRGYALKLCNETVTIPEGMATDWGGYGILAPEPSTLRGA